MVRDCGGMTHPIWPLFDVRITTPRLEIRYVEVELAAELATLAAGGIHDPKFMPFTDPWTDTKSPDLERSALRYYWRSRVETTPSKWTLNFAVVIEGTIAGTTGLTAHDFPILRQFETGSWLGRAFQGQGIGKEMRRASLHLGFAGLLGEWATTAAFDNNESSMGVTRSLGYTPTGHRRLLQRDTPGRMMTFEMSRADWRARLRADDIHLHGVEECLAMLGLAATADEADTSSKLPPERG